MTVRRRARRALVLTLGATAALALLSPGAHAGTASVVRESYVTPVPHGEEVVEYDTIAYRAAPGETNRLTATRVTDTSASFRDDGAEVEAGQGCQQVSEHEVLCSGTAEQVTAEAHLGDRDDDVTLVEPHGSTLQLHAVGGSGEDTLRGSEAGFGLSGGPGDDTLIASTGGSGLNGGPGDDTVRGGPGNDSISGRSGSDTIDAGDGSDWIATGSGRDLADGGPGDDVVSYSNRRKPVDVDLARPDGNGQAGENDHIENVEDVEGGGASDRLVGDGRDNELSGAGDLGYDPQLPGARDVLIGRGGDDHLAAGSGPDVLDGGEGNDWLEGRASADVYRAGPGDDELWLDGRRTLDARVGCGDGDDRVEDTIRRSVVPQTCERVWVYDVDVLTGLTWLDDRTLAMRVRQDAYDDGLEDRACRALVRVVRRRGRPLREVLLGQDLVRLRPGRLRRAEVQLTELGRRTLVPGRSVRIQVELRGDNRCHGPFRGDAHPYGQFTLSTVVPQRAR